ncbi:MAG TPA: hypothetical protein PK295_01750 [Candidatus Magasanikbacteria bacterium]|nr:hypothetical protein [Candidatus Magasanikbacteria bacterium]
MPRSKKRITPTTHKKKTRRAKKHPVFPVLFLRYRRHLMSMILAISILGGLTIYIIARVYTKPEFVDDRADRIDAYFEKHNMPLEGHGKQFVAAADRCGMDWRLLPAIAVRESTGGKRMQYNNPFGWGGATIPFADFDEAIDVVALNLCGDNPKTARWYSTTSTYRKLYFYNGTVIPTYPNEVLWIMRQF